jgi:hypothetical protein
MRNKTYHGDTETRRRRKSLKHRGKEEAEAGKKETISLRICADERRWEIAKPTTETRRHGEKQNL